MSERKQIDVEELKKENMRLVTNRANLQMVGAVFHKRIGKYQALIYIGKLISLGYFKTEQEAHRAHTIACEHIDDYKDNKSFRELIKNEMEGSRVGQ